MNLTEDYCSFELSKLLKEKGFDVELQCYSYDAVTKENVDIYWQKNINGLLPRCTHQMAMKWLREVHKIFISIGIGDDIDGVFGYMAEIYCLEGLSCPYGEYRYIPNVDADTISDKIATTYEEAVEAALRYSLENMI